MEILPEIKNRKSVRKFLDKEVSDEIVEALLRAGMSAPSAINKRPWHFYVIRSNKAIKAVINQMPFGKYNPALIIIPCIKEELTLKGEAHNLAYADLAAATENILIEAVHQGLGSLWCAVYPDIRRIEGIRNALDIPNGITPYSSIYIGYEDGNESPKDKFDKSRISIL